MDKWLKSVTRDQCINCQTYCYLSSHGTSLPCDWYQIILLGDRGTCVWTICPALERLRVELMTSWVASQCLHHYTTSHEVCWFVSLVLMSYLAACCWLCHVYRIIISDLLGSILSHLYVITGNRESEHISVKWSPLCLMSELSHVAIMSQWWTVLPCVYLCEIKFFVF